MKRKFARVACALCAVVAVGMLSGCNTVAGAGKDISAAGHATTKAADSAK